MAQVPMSQVAQISTGREAQWLPAIRSNTSPSLRIFTGPKNSLNRSACSVWTGMIRSGLIVAANFYSLSTVA
jgi:hypothetical protein